MYAPSLFRFPSPRLGFLLWSTHVTEPTRAPFVVRTKSPVACPAGPSFAFSLFIKMLSSARFYYPHTMLVPIRLLCAVSLVLSLAGCKKSPERSAAEFAERGKVFLAKKEFERAVLELRNAVQLVPNNPETEFLLGEAYRGSGNLGTAMRHFRKATDLNGQHHDAQLRVAELLSATAETELLGEAEKRAEGVLAARPGNADVLQVVAFAELKQNKLKEAADHLQQALSANPSHVSSVLTLAALHLASGKPEHAEQTLRSMAERNPNSSELQLAMAQFYRVTGQLPKAEAHLRHMVSRNPKDAAALLELAKVEANSGNREAAGETLKTLAGSEDKYRLLYALFLFDAGRQDAAIAELEDMLKKGSKDRQVRARLIDFYMSSGKEAKGQELLAEALRRDPGDADALEQRAAAHVVARRFADAERDLLEALRVRPDSARAHYLKGQVHCALGKPLVCRQELEQALRLDPYLLQARLLLSETLRNSRAVKSALQVMDTTPAEQRKHPAAVAERGWALLALGRADEAAALVEAQLPVTRTPVLLLQQGLLRMARQQFGPGRESLEEVLRAEPSNVQALDAIAQTFVAEKRPNDAVERIRRQVAVNARSPEVPHLLGNWLERSGDKAGAIAAYSTALSRDSAFSMSAIAAARLHMLDRRWEDARRLTRSVLATQPANRDALLALAMLEEGGGNRNAAIEAYRTLLGNSPDDFVALNNLAVRLAEDRSTVDEALRMAERAKEVAPDNPAVDDTIGWIYYQKGLYPTAVRHLTAAAKDGDARTYYHLAMAHFKAGNRKPALGALEKATALDPNLPEANITNAMASAAQ